MYYGRKSCWCLIKYLYVTDSEKCSTIFYKMFIYLLICTVNIRQGPLQTAQNVRLLEGQDFTAYGSAKTLNGFGKLYV